MAIEVTCPSCNRHFNAPDSAAGKKAKCPTCGGVIVISSGASAAPPIDAIFDAEQTPEHSLADDDDLGLEPPATLSTNIDRRPCPMCGEMIATDAVKCRYCGEVFDRSLAGVIGGTGDMRDPGWRKVRTGLTMIYYSTIGIVFAVIVLAIGGAILGAALGPGGRGNGPPPALTVLILIGGLLVLGAGVCVFIGEALCTAVPASSGARGYAIGAVVCMIVNVLCSVTGRAIGVPPISGLGSLVNLVGTVLFIFFIRRCATHLRDGQLADSAGKFLTFAITILVGGFFVGILGAALQLPAIFAILGLLIIVLGLVAFVWYMRLITSLKTAIDRRMGF